MVITLSPPPLPRPPQHNLFAVRSFQHILSVIQHAFLRFIFSDFGFLLSSAGGMTCNNAAELYCWPTLNSGCWENQTYVLEYNAAFKSINKVSLVDIYLYHGDSGTIATKISGQSNDGSYSFSVDEVTIPFQWVFFHVTLISLEMVQFSTHHDNTILPISMVCRPSRERIQCRTIKSV